MNSICIDGYNLALTKGSGIATYGRNLLPNLRGIGLGTQALYGPAHHHSENDVANEVALADAERLSARANKVERYQRTLLSRFGRTARPIMPGDEVIWAERPGGRPDVDYFWGARDLFHIANRSFDVYGAFTPVSFQPTAAAPRPTVINWTTTLPMYARGALNVYTIHDLIPLRLPHSTADNKEAYFALCKEIARRADHIIAVSETTRSDVIRLLGVDPSRITNTYQSVAIPPEFSERSDKDVQRELEGIFDLGWKDYFLFFGAIEPKKNLGRIVEAYLASGVETPLVIVGGRAWLEGAETQLLSEVMRDGGPPSRRIRQYDFLSRQVLISLIRGAKATLFPSLYEGFGLPVLESMLMGTPVLTSTAGSLPEVAGDAALMVDPYDVQAITSGIQALDADEGLRNELVVKGRARAVLYDETAYRARLTEVYRGLGVV